MIVYTCPKCGTDLILYLLMCNPPIEVAKCNNCGFEDRKQEQTIRQSYPVKEED